MPHFFPKISVVLSSLILSACGGSSGGGGDTPKTNTNPSPTAPTYKSRQDSIIKSTAVSDSSCPNGGVQIEMGIDANGNGLLDQAEIDNSRTEVVCHGKNAVDPIPTLFDISQPTAEECEHGGKKITLGSDSNGNGLLDSSEISHNEFLCNALITVNQPASLISTLAEPAGENCTNGGTKVIAGLDNNSNQKLDNNEVQTTTYVCTGGNGTNGTDGSDGSNGLTSLIATTTEIAGENCAAGGTKIETGLDINGNNILEVNEITATSYICSGGNGSDGQDGTGTPTGNSAKVLIASIKEAPGSNCLHGGYQHQIGSDLNQDNVLQNNEVTSSSYSCNPNQAPSLEADSQQPAVPGYRFNLRLLSLDSSDFGYDPVEIIILEKPDWLEVTGNSDNELYLSGIAAGNIGDSFTVKASSTDTDLTTEKTFTFDLVKGIYVSVEGNDVIEGNLKADGTPETTPAEFRIKLSEASEEKIVVNFNFNSSASLPKKSWKAHGFDQVNGNRAIFEAGEIEKIVPISVFGNNNLEFIKAIALRIEHAGYYSSSDQVRPPVIYQNIHTINITNDDAEVIRLGSDENLRVNLASWIGGVEDLQVTGDSPKYFDHEKIRRGDCNYYCLNYSELIVSSTASVANIGESFTLNFSGKYHQAPFNQEVTFQVIEGDTDGDGVLNSADAFPTIANSHTDSDQDGLGDEWEMANFESLELADGTTDFDNNGTTDLQAFLSDTPINDLNFDFESGELPSGWVNSGNINWVVTDEHSYQSDYALAIEQPLAPGEEAIITFTVSTQAGTMELYSRVIENQTGNYELKLRKNNSITNNLNTGSYWWSNSTNFEAGNYSLQLRYENRSSTHNAPKIYVDSIRGLVGWLPADRDGDGVLNSVDLYPDRSDAATDSDNDGIGDEWEVRYFGTLDRVDATTDHDNDGLLDVHEFSLKANPTSRYTDGDGVSDGDDAFPAQSEYQSDTDNDGLADKWERIYFGSLDVSDGTQDSDSDGTPDLAEFKAQTPPTPDRDNDGAADVVDAFPDNPEYKLDSDNDGIADEWESQHGNTSRYSDTRDYDGDGRNDLTEFLEGTDPNEKNLNAVEDIFALAKGETINLNLTANDISQEDDITVVSVTAPTSGLGTVTENADGSFSYTASDNYLGWVNFSYTANDGVSDSTGEIFVRITAETPPHVVKVDGGSNYSMALFSDGSLYSWGNNSYGQLGHGDTENRPVPTQIIGISDVKDFDLGSKQVIASTNSGKAWLWGKSQTTPTKLTAIGVQTVAIREGDYYGANYYLLTSDGKVSQGNSIVSGDLTNIIQIAAGREHLLMLSNNGDVWALGDNGYGQLGNGSNTDSNTPVAVSKLNNIRSIEAGNNQSFAIDNNGDLFAWGDNYSGRLGDGTTTNRNVPVQITSLSDVQSVSAGYDHTLVLLENGQLYGMGYNSYGELTNNSGSTPRFIAEDIHLMGTGQYTSFMVNNQNLAFGFGSNGSGRLGDGTTQSRSTPTEISWLQEGVVSELGKESFEWGRIPPYWRNSGSNWEIVNSQAIDGSYSVRVKDRLNDYESASLGFQVTTAAGDMTFKVKTSTEANHDILKFKIDGVEQDLSIYHSSGENDWGTSATFALEAGLHSFEWVYAKDGGTSEGDDTVWLDDIRLPLDSDGDGSLDHIDTEPYNAAVQ